MKKESLQSELFRNGLIERGDLEEIRKFKRDRHRRLSKEANKEFLRDKKVKSLVFDQSDYKRIQNLAREYKMPEATFLKACIFGYIDSVYIPVDKQAVTNISNLLLDIKNAVLHSLSLVTMNGEIKHEDLQTITQQIADLEYFISSTLNNPPRLSVWIQREVAKDPQFLPHLLQAVSQYLISK